MGRRAQRWHCRTSSGEVTATHPDHRHRRPLRAAAARDRRARRPSPGALFHSARWDHDGRPGRQAGRGHRHRRLGDPDRPRGAAGGRPPRRLPAHRPVGDPPQRPHLPAARARRAAPRPGARAALPHRRSTGRTRATCRRSPGSRGWPRPPRRPPWSTSTTASRTPALRAKVTPHFRIGCKRVLRSNTYYPALAADNVDLVTDPIARVTRRPRSSPPTASSTRST